MSDSSPLQQPTAKPPVRTQPKAQQEQSKPAAFEPAHVPETPATGASRINVGSQERWISVLSGAALGWLALRRGGLFSKLLLGGAAAGLIYRGSTGYCAVNQALGRNTAEGSSVDDLQIQETFTIFKPAQELYDYWRKLENLPSFMQFIDSVVQMDERRSHWKAKFPGVPDAIGSIAWDAEITEDEPGHRIAYRSLPGSQIDMAGEVLFATAPGNRGTEVRSIMRYRAPGGAAGQAVAKLFNKAFAEAVRSDLRRFKMLMETGEVPTIAGQSSGRGRDIG